MITDKRQIFLEHFLGLYEVDKVEIINSDIDKICGNAVYLDDDVKQEFCWHISEKDVPSDDLIQLIKLIKDYKFHITDKIIVTADTIFEKTGFTDRAKFNLTYDRLFDIEVKMIDDGEETDSYFIHD